MKVSKVNQVEYTVAIGSHDLVHLRTQFSWNRGNEQMDVLFTSLYFTPAFTSSSFCATYSQLVFSLTKVQSVFYERKQFPITYAFDLAFFPSWEAFVSPFA